MYRVHAILNVRCIVVYLMSCSPVNISMYLISVTALFERVYTASLGAALCFALSSTAMTVGMEKKLILIKIGQCL